MNEWWASFCKKAVTVPLDPAKFPDSAAYHQAWGDGESFGVRCDPRAVNEALHQLGCTIRLRWTTEKVTLANGKERNSYRFERGRFRLGQQNGEIPRKNGLSFHQPPQIARAMMTD